MASFNERVRQITGKLPSEMTCHRVPDGVKFPGVVWASDGKRLLCACPSPTPEKVHYLRIGDGPIGHGVRFVLIRREPLNYMPEAANDVLPSGPPPWSREWEESDPRV